MCIRMRIRICMYMSMGMCGRVRVSVSACACACACVCMCVSSLDPAGNICAFSELSKFFRKWPNCRNPVTHCRVDAIAWECEAC